VKIPITRNVISTTTHPASVIIYKGFMRFEKVKIKEIYEWGEILFILVQILRVCRL
jgi:hypothetical protein